MAGRLVRVDKATRDLTIETQAGALLLLPYHALDCVHLGAAEPLGSPVEAPAPSSAAKEGE